ncbi:hypothetical protein [Peribacillus glennii]|uniref:Spore coat protein CotO n=1 Tax=Peribacillus glennii TaxID=2303991 RepID=A0A372LDJ9_9BACI|nr:hypothetical protein [Peribacillus glennii]RFU64107.1 hypothetical protein D0466_09235 [Peribacillus glennii]
MKKNDDKTSNPLLYIVQPNLPPQQAPEMQQVYRTKVGDRKGEHGVEHQDSEFFQDEQMETMMPAFDREEKEDQQKKKEEEEKLEKIKHEFGVYDALKEISDEIALVQKIKEQQLNQYAAPLTQKDTDRNETADQGSRQLDVDAMLDKLSRHPAKTKKPTCEANVNGKSISFRVLNKRKDIVIVQEGERIYDLHVSDIKELRIL